MTKDSAKKLKLIHNIKSLVVPQIEDYPALELYLATILVYKSMWNELGLANNEFFYTLAPYVRPMTVAEVNWARSKDLLNKNTKETTEKINLLSGKVEK